MNEEAPSPPEEKSARDTAADDMAARDVVKKPGRLGVLWGKLGLDKGTVIMMFKCVAGPVRVGRRGVLTRSEEAWRQR